MTGINERNHTVKIRVSFTVDIDPEAWATEYGVAPEDVRTDVQSYLGQNAHTQLADLGLLA